MYLRDIYTILYLCKTDKTFSLSGDWPVAQTAGVARFQGVNLVTRRPTYKQLDVFGHPKHCRTQFQQKATFVGVSGSNWTSLLVILRAPPKSRLV